MQKKKPANPDSIRARLQARPPNSRQTLVSGANVEINDDLGGTAPSDRRRTVLKKGHPYRNPQATKAGTAAEAALDTAIGPIIRNKTLEGAFDEATGTADAFYRMKSKKPELGAKGRNPMGAKGTASAAKARKRSR